MTFKMPYSGGGPRQTSPLYQEITKSVNKDGNIVTTTNIAATEGTAGTPGYTIPGKPSTPPPPAVVTPSVDYPPTGPDETQEEANIRWQKRLDEKKKNNSNPNPKPVPEVIPPVVTPGGPGGNTPPNSTPSIGSGGTPDVVVPATPGTPGTPGSSSSVIKPQPPKPVRGNLSASIDRIKKTPGDLQINLPRINKGPNLRPIGRAAVDIALAPFDLLKGIFGRKCKGGCPETIGDHVGILGGRRSIRRGVFNGRGN